MDSLLPKHIDYTKYYNKSGMDTNFWGPNLWNFLFTSIIGYYPIRINELNNEHLILKTNYYNLCMSLQHLLPCIYCRKSYKQFLSELPIEPYLIGRIELMYWVYLMKDKVNKKLIKQELQCFDEKKLELNKMFYLKKITNQEYIDELRRAKQEIFKTIPTPDFKTVLDKYEMYRASCSEKTKKCTTEIPTRN